MELSKKDELLIKLIEFALVELADNARPALAEKAALKLLVHLTATKPHVPPET